MSEFSNTLSRGVASLGLRLREASPHILFGAGVIGVVGAGVLACKATLNVEEKIDKIHEDFEAVKGMKETSETLGTSYSKDQYHKDLGYVTVKAAKELGKLYGPALLLGIASIAALGGSHIQMTRRNKALGVALTAVTTAYSEYRGRVRELFGVDRENEIYMGVREVEVVSEDGRITTEIQTDPSRFSPYARCFDEQSSEWQRNAVLNRMFVEGVQAMANTRLRAKGFVFLNEIYSQLGFDEVPEGQIVGWYWQGEGDNFIDFGLGRTDPATTAFMDGAEQSVWLDFNVDGRIFDRIGK